MAPFRTFSAHRRHWTRNPWSQQLLRWAFERDDGQMLIAIKERALQLESIARLSGDKSRGPAQWERRGQRSRGSMRGCLLAGLSRK